MAVCAGDVLNSGFCILVPEWSIAYIEPRAIWVCIYFWTEKELQVNIITWLQLGAFDISQPASHQSKNPFRPPISDDVYPLVR